MMIMVTVAIMVFVVITVITKTLLERAAPQGVADCLGKATMNCSSQDYPVVPGQLPLGGLRAIGEVWSSHLPVTQEIMGSNPI